MANCGSLALDLSPGNCKNFAVACKKRKNFFAVKDVQFFAVKHFERNVVVYVSENAKESEGHR